MSESSFAEKFSRMSADRADLVFENVLQSLTAALHLDPNMITDIRDLRTRAENWDSPARYVVVMELAMWMTASSIAKSAAQLPVDASPEEINALATNAMQEMIDAALSRFQAQVETLAVTMKDSLPTPSSLH